MMNLNHIIFRIFLLMIVIIPGVVAGQSDTPTTGSSPLEPYEGTIRLENQWEKVQKYISNIGDPDLDGLKIALEKISQERYNLGFHRIRLFSQALANASYNCSKNGYFEKAFLLSKYAQAFDPTFPPAYYSEGRAYMRKSFTQIPRAISLYIKGFREGFGYFWKRFFFLGNLIIGLSYSVAIALGLFIFFLFIKYQELIRHEIIETFPMRFTSTVGMIVSFFVLLAPLVFTLKLLWVYVFWMVLGWIYFSEKEKILTWLLIGFMLVSPMILKYINMVVTAYNNPLYRLGVFSSTGGYDLNAEQELLSLMKSDEENPYYPFLLGYFYQKREQYYHAKDYYEMALKIDSSMAKARNNLGCVYFALNNLEKAKTEYSTAISYDPTLAAPHFNLSRLFDTQYEFDKANEELSEAKSLNPDLVSYYVNINIGQEKNQDPDRILVSVGLSEKELKNFMNDYYFRKGIDYSAVWNQRFWGLKADQIPWAAVLAVLISLILQSFRTKRGYAMFCKMCGVPACPKCMIIDDKKISDVHWRFVTVWPLVSGKKLDVSTQADVFCSRCKTMFSRKEDTAASLRLERMHEMERRKRMQARLHKIYSFVSPGIGYANQGHTWKGFFMFWFWILLIMVALSRNVFLETPYDIQLGDGAQFMSKMFIIVIIGYYIVTTYFASKLRGIR